MDLPLAALPRLDGATATAADLVAALDEAGGAVVERLLPDDEVDALAAELEPHRLATATGTDDFSGFTTTRTGSLVARSPLTRRLVQDPVVAGAAEIVLRRKAKTFQLHLTQLIAIGPGGPAQPLHRDQWAWDFFPFPAGHDVEVSSIWALDDFTEENGATHLVPGSHRWPDKVAIDPSWTVRATMPRGSVVVYLGSLFHGAGENRSAAVRRGINLDWCAGWLRQEENQYLACPPDVARTLPEGLAKLVGYQRGGLALGYFGDTQDPMEALDPATVRARGF